VQNGCETGSLASGRKTRQAMRRAGKPRRGSESTAADPWVSLEDIADPLGVKSETVYKLIVRKKLPARKVGRQWRLRQVEVGAWVSSGKAAIPRQSGEVHGT